MREEFLPEKRYWYLYTRLW